MSISNMMDEGFDSVSYLKKAAQAVEEDVDLGLCLLAVVAGGEAAQKTLRYNRQLKRYVQDVRARYDELVAAGSADDWGVRLAALKHVFEVYQLDPPDHEPLESFDVMRTLERGSGSAMMIGVLCLDAARHAGWDVCALSVPGQIFCRMEHAGQRVLFDPARGCMPVEAHHMRAAVKEILGAKAEIKSDYTQVRAARDIVVDVCNVLKLRRIEMGDYAIALEVVERMRMLCPDEYRLLLDAGVLYARTDSPKKAIAALEGYVERAPNHYDRQEALNLLRDLQGRV